MKTLISILIIASFLQSTIIPLNIVLIVLICRTYITKEKNNLYLAFFFGLFISHLNLSVIGLQSIIYISIVQVTQILSRSRLATNYLTIIPISFVLLSANHLAISFFTNQSIQLIPQVLIESCLSLVIFFLVKLWEERFVVRKDIKLRL